MATIESEMEHKTPEEISQIIESGAEKYSFEDEKEYSKTEIEDSFRYMYAVFMEGDHIEASRVLSSLRPIIDTFGIPPENFEAAFDFLVEWSLLAIRLTSESKNEFSCMPLYFDFFEVLKNAPENLKYKSARIRLQMALHYDLWLSKGGNPDLLSEEDFELLSTAKEKFLIEAPAFLQEAKIRKDADGCVSLLRNLARYYLTENQPNEGLKFYKEIPDFLPGTKDYHVADMGDTYMEIGKIYLAYKKHQTAKKYFEMAKEIYLAQGPEWEMIALQAEANIETCESFL